MMNANGNQPVDLATLLAFIKQPTRQMQMPNIEIPASDPWEQRLKEAKGISEIVDNLFGKPGYKETMVPSTLEGGMGIADIAGTGLYDQSIPMSQRHTEMNKRMIASGYPSLVNQGLSNISSVSGTDSTNLEMNLQAAGLKPGTPEYQKAVMDYLMKAQTQINLGDTGEKAQVLTNDEKLSLGLDKKAPYYWEYEKDTGGFVPKLVQQTPGAGRQQTASAEIEVSGNELETALSDYETKYMAWKQDPYNYDKFIEASTSKGGLDLAVSNRVNWKGEPGEATIDSARKMISSPLSINSVIALSGKVDPILSAIESVRSMYNINKNQNQNQKYSDPKKEADYQKWKQEQLKNGGTQ